MFNGLYLSPTKTHVTPMNWFSSKQSRLCSQITINRHTKITIKTKSVPSSKVSGMRVVIHVCSKAEQRNVLAVYPHLEKYSSAINFNYSNIRKNQLALLIKKIRNMFIKPLLDISYCRPALVSVIEPVRICTLLLRWCNIMMCHFW